ncbi:MAG: 30S ribosomal protein S7 [bacterium]|nr:30S ribosomal protein S7 [bacterium]
MTRRRKDFKRVHLPDSKYGSPNITKFINRVMLQGKKSTAEGIVYSCLLKLAEETKETPIDAFNTAIKNVMPLMEVKSRRVGGSTYQVPIEVRQPRAIALAMKWIIEYARKRSGRSMVSKLSQELIDAFNNVGTSVKKREDTHKMAEANKAFAHFRW